MYYTSENLLEIKLLGTNGIFEKRLLWTFQGKVRKSTNESVSDWEKY